MMRAPILLLFAVALLAPEPAFAQAACSVGNANDNSLDQIVNLYRSCARQWEATLGAHALTLFWLLAAIEFVWAAIRLVLRGADFNEWLAELVTQVFFLGLFLALLTNATAWTGAIVESFRTAAAEALRANGVASGIAPSDIFDTGVNIATRMLEQFSIFSAPVQSLFLVAASLVILVCFALIAAALILALVESYIVLSAGVLLLGFGGSQWTKDFAVKTLIYAVSVGAKLFVLQLIAGLGAQIVGAWARLPVGSSLFSPANATSNILVILGSTLVLWVLVKSVPDMIQGLINGTALGANTGLAGAVASLAGSAYALGMVVSSARDLSREQITEAQLANPGQSGPGMARRSLGNIGSAAVANIGTSPQRSRRPRQSHRAGGWRTAPRGGRPEMRARAQRAGRAAIRDTAFHDTLVTAAYFAAGRIGNTAAVLGNAAIRLDGHCREREHTAIAPQEALTRQRQRHDAYGEAIAHHGSRRGPPVDGCDAGRLPHRPPGMAGALRGLHRAGQGLAARRGDLDANRRLEPDCRDLSGLAKPDRPLCRADRSHRHCQCRRSCRSHGAPRSPPDHRAAGAVGRRGSHGLCRCRRPAPADQ